MDHLESIVGRMWPAGRSLPMTNVDCVNKKLNQLTNPNTARTELIESIIQC